MGFTTPEGGSIESFLLAGVTTVLDKPLLPHVVASIMKGEANCSLLGRIEQTVCTAVVSLLEQEILSLPSHTNIALNFAFAFPVLFRSAAASPLQFVGIEGIGTSCCEIGRPADARFVSPSEGGSL